MPMPTARGTVVDDLGDGDSDGTGEDGELPPGTVVDAVGGLAPLVGPVGPVDSVAFDGVVAIVVTAAIVVLPEAGRELLGSGMSAVLDGETPIVVNKLGSVSC